jgi:organic radical activating enzyme
VASRQAKGFVNLNKKKSMVKQIISADAYKTRKVFQKDGENYLNVSEFFYDTIQGEGIYAGHPAAFLRLAGCSLSCNYCDTTEVWRHGSKYTFEELFELIGQSGLIGKLFFGQHLVITGGSPILQQKRLGVFLSEFEKRYNGIPFIEIENECVGIPSLLLCKRISCWNNSPKLSGAGLNRKKRYKPEVIQRMSTLKNSWFKFVVDCEEDWEEIQMDFLQTELIRKDQIILMPQGATRMELEKNRPIVVDIAIQHGVRYSDRLHIQLWDKTVGV